MIQGGCPHGTGTGGPGYYDQRREFAQNGFTPTASHMIPECFPWPARCIRTPQEASSLSCMKKAPHLDGAYAAFGRITEGMDVVDRIAEAATDYSDRPLEEQRMKKVTVETFGEDYGEPETV